MITTYAKASYNDEKLLEEIRSPYPVANLMSGDGNSSMAFVRVEMPDGTQQASWDAIGSIITAHNGAALTASQQTKADRDSIISKAALAVQFIPDLKKLLNVGVDIDIANNTTTDSAFEAIMTVMNNDVSLTFRNKFYGALNREQSISLLGLSLLQLLALLPNQKRITLTYLRIFMNEYITLALFGTLNS